MFLCLFGDKNKLPASYLANPSFHRVIAFAQPLVNGEFVRAHGLMVTSAQSKLSAIVKSRVASFGEDHGFIKQSDC